MTTSISEAWAGPRERAVAIGVEHLGDGELLALVLGTGRAGLPVGVLAVMLLEEHGGVAGLARAGIGQLVQRAGVGTAKAARLMAAVELGRRAVGAASREGHRAHAGFGPRSRRGLTRGWRRSITRSCWLLALDGHHGLRAARRVASGGIHGLHVAARDVLRIALREGASAFVLVHNHPSGDPAPSPEDIAFTRTVERAAAIVGTPLLDHVVVARRRATSMLDTGAHLTASR